MWSRTVEGVLESDLLGRLPWLRHGFGTRISGQWPGTYTHLKQVHSNHVVAADGGSGCLGEGDALITATPGTRIGIRTADCVPVLLADPERRAVAVVHAGWRGTVSEIARRTVEHLRDRFGTQPADLRAAIGPCIGNCCFEVGSDVAAKFEAYLPQAALSTRIDLVAANIRQLQDAGLRPEHIDSLGYCTVCEPELFYSFRRDKTAGRMVSAIEVPTG
jgi:polyphenol oxidase